MGFGFDSLRRLSMQTCPYCKNNVRDREVRCDRCGTRMDGRIDAPGSHPLMLIGGLMLVAGFVASVYFFAIFDTSVPSGEVGKRIANISLISQRSTGMTFGVGLLVAGAVLLGFSRSRK